MKPNLVLSKPDPNIDDIIAMFKALTGRDPTEEELVELRAEMGQQEKQS